LWNSSVESNQLVLPIPYSFFATPPVITLSNFKNPLKCQTISLKAFLVLEPDSEPPVLGVPYSSNLESLYIALWQPAKNDITYHENLHILCNGPLTPNQHLIIQISGNDAPVGIAVLVIPSESGEVQATVFEQTTLPPNYLTKSKSRKITLTVTLHSF